MTQPRVGGVEGADHHPNVDWEAVERSPEFRELIRRKKAFVIPATLFFMAWYFGFIILAGYAEDFMGSEFLTDGLTVGYVLALTQFIMTWVLGWLYLRQSDKVFDPLAARARERVAEMTGATGDGAPPASRFDRTAEGAEASEREVPPR